MPDNGRESPGGSERVWHPAHEWLEEDEVDTNHHPAQEPDDDGSEGDLPIEDEAMSPGYDDDGKSSA